MEKWKNWNVTLFFGINDHLIIKKYPGITTRNKLLWIMSRNVILNHIVAWLLLFVVLYQDNDMVLVWRWSL